MGELKHGFGAAKMNKDADERTVPNGEYRDALNVQIVTSDGSNVGTLQTLLGNTNINDIHMASSFQAILSPYAKCVGSVADEANNKIYYLVQDYSKGTDYIFEYNLSIPYLKPIVVDKWRVTTSVSISSFASAGVPATKFYISDDGSPNNNITNVRPGMIVQGYFTGGWTYNITQADQIIVNKMVHDGAGNWEVYMDDLLGNTTLFNGSGLESQGGTSLTLFAERALNFQGTPITGINIIDNILYWTDGTTEPKKIRIGNVSTLLSGLQHTKFRVKVGGTTIQSAGVPTTIDFRENPDYIKEQHLTVIKKSPLYPPTLLLSSTANFRFNSNTTSILDSSITTCFVDEDNSPMSVGSIKNGTFTTTPDYNIGDLILLSRTNDFSTQEEFIDYELIVEILDYSSSNGYVKLKIAYISNDLVGHEFGINDTFNSMLKQEKPLYEFKFPRFAYRYKYQDDQYSTYSPFSEVAFLPGKFDYKPKDGYNLGMVNNLRSLYVCDFLPDKDTLPKDVVEVDVVYKESNTNNVYIVKTIKYGDSEWHEEGSSVVTVDSGDSRTKGAILITSEMVKAAVASNQLLRPWDNVPRTARAQEMIGNRVVYANYLQNYNLK